MGLIQRIFYFHVPSGWSAFVAFFIVLRRQHRLSAQRARRSGIGWRSPRRKSGVAFVTVVLVTGPIWAHPVWGIWWTWDARLTSTFVLWVLYVCYLLLRTLIDEPERRAVVSAVFGIFAAFDIPLVYFSIWFFRTQHPQPVIGDWRLARSPHAGRAAALLGGHAGVLALLLRQRYRLEALRWEVDQLRLNLDRPAPSRSAWPLSATKAAPHDRARKRSSE